MKIFSKPRFVFLDVNRSRSHLKLTENLGVLEKAKSPRDLREENLRSRLAISRFSRRFNDVLTSPSMLA